MLEILFAEIFLVLIRLTVSWFVLFRLHSVFQLPGRVAIFLAVSASASSTIINDLTAQTPSCSECSISGLGLVLVALSQALYSFILTCPLGIALELIPLSGRIVDILRGNQLAEQFLPELPDKQSALEQLGSMVAVYAFFELGIWSKWLGSILFVPEGSRMLLYLSESVLHSELNSNFGMILIRDLQQCFTSGLLIAAPVFVAILIIELISICLARALPRISFTFEILPVKLVAILVLVPPMLDSGHSALGELELIRTFCSTSPRFSNRDAIQTGSPVSSLLVGE